MGDGEKSGIQHKRVVLDEVFEFLAKTSKVTGGAMAAQ